MSNLLHKLENNEQVLLMYLGDELPREDHAEVQRMLGTDAGLRAMLGELSGLRELTLGRLALLDAAPDAAAEEASVRRTLREMRRYQTEQSLRPTIDEAPVPGRRYPWWVYSAGSIAAAVVILLGLWGLNVIDVLDTRPTTPIVNNDQSDALPRDVIMAELERSLGGWQASAEETEAGRHVEALQAEENALALFGSM